MQHEEEDTCNMRKRISAIAATFVLRAPLQHTMCHHVRSSAAHFARSVATHFVRSNAPHARV
jgi:hypothetical protein